MLLLGTKRWVIRHESPALLAERNGGGYAKV